MVGIGLLAGLRTRVPSIPSLRADIDNVSKSKYMRLALSKSNYGE